MRFHHRFCLGAAFVALVFLGCGSLAQSAAMEKIQGEYRVELIKALDPSEREEANALFERLKARGLSEEDITHFDAKFGEILAKKTAFVDSGKRWPKSLDREELELIRTITNHAKGTPYN
jgi:ABC-type polar amino acid transport system ATPase subunit